jgi:hypothetical protein
MFHAKYLRSSSWRFLKEDFSSLYYIHKGKNNDPPVAGPIFTPWLLFEQTW